MSTLAADGQTTTRVRRPGRRSRKGTLVTKLRWIFALQLILLAPTPGLSAAGVPADSGRTVAVTFDDLPAARTRDLANLTALTEALVGQITALGLPAVGFVTENKLAEAPGQEAARAALLEKWLDAGLELGNHTRSHAWFWRTPLAEMQEEVLTGERVTRPLCLARGRAPRWFRHPMLNTGPDLETKAAFEAFLAGRGYRVAPVTFDSDEYVHARAYELARERGDVAAADSVAREYLRYMEEIVLHFEGLSRRVLGREPAQILLLHANWLNAEHLDELAALLKDRGYRFVTLEAALADPAYQLPDAYIGARGMSWLERWALTQGQDPGHMPEAPDWVRRAAGL
jgi:peptidoglycan/xylan/chitin deacetylase (PgdA/CDA1 family)